MARKILVMGKDGARPLLTEIPASNELQLQTLLRDTPDLLPADELGVTGPLLVVGRETSLPSGAVDLVAMGRGGDILIVELKTGPQNPDFRAALSQAIDYGADLWGMTPDVFESSVVQRYFSGPHCHDPSLRATKSLAAATRITWPDMSDDELLQFNERVQQQLATGSFLYVVAAQRFTPTMLRTIEYLNARMNGPQFAAVELVAFAAGDLQAFESRTAARPQSRTRQSSSSSVDEATFLESVTTLDYRAVLEDLFDFCRGQQLYFEWGTVGVSIRAKTPDTTEPLTIAWIFPPGRAGWQGLTDLTLGYDSSSLTSRPSAKGAAEAYTQAVAAISGGISLTQKTLRGRKIPQSIAISQLQAIKDAIAGFVAVVNEGHGNTSHSTSHMVTDTQS